ncbi:MAG TPA: hypothetical protein VHO84_01380 [Syntrophorhabdaceae bacterium]|nr:hypothetical protein [Syntrophorhabdaceae bacterium]
MNSRTAGQHENSSLDFLLTHLGIIFFIVVNVMLMIMGVVIFIQYYHLF